MKKKDLIVLIIVLLLIAIGTFLPEKVEKILSVIRESLLSQKAGPLPVGTEERLDIILPEVPRESAEAGPLVGPLAEGSAETIQGLMEEEAFFLGMPVSEKPGLSFAQIKKRVGEIEQEKEIIAVKVAKLVEASEEKAITGKVQLPASEEQVEQEARLTEIQEQIKDISGKIAIISAQIVELTQALGTGA